MYRAVVLTTLVILLLMIAGVSVAQESGIFAAESNGDDPPGSTTLERTSFGATVAEDQGPSVPPSVSSGPEDGEVASEPTVVTEPTVEENEEPTVGSPVVEEKQVPEKRAPRLNNVGKPGNSGRGVGKPEDAGKAPNIGTPRPDVGHPANGKPEELGNEVEHGRGGGQRKVTLCHKVKNTLTVGLPAQAAHLRHGDHLGVCP